MTPEKLARAAEFAAKTPAMATALIKLRDATKTYSGVELTADEVDALFDMIQVLRQP